jgi:hypothetical protein
MRSTGAQLFQAGLGCLGAFVGLIAGAIGGLLLMEAITPGGSHDQGGMIRLLTAPVGALLGGGAGVLLGGLLTRPRPDRRGRGG